MPLFFDRSALGTSINIDTDIPKISNTTFTAARKFSSPVDPNQPGDQSGVKSNDEHMIEHAASMKGIAIAAESIATEAVLGLQAARDQLSNVSGQVQQDVRTSLPNKTEFDVASLADVRSQNLAASLRLSIPILDTRAIADDLHKNISANVFKVKLDAPAPVSFNPIVPQLDSIAVDMAKNRGSIDCFFSHLRFSLPLSQVWNGKVKAIRIFRSTIINPLFQRDTPPVITVRGLERLSTLRMASRSKGLEQITAVENRYREAGVLTALSILSPIDPQTNTRMSTNSSDRFVAPVISPAAVASKTGQVAENVSSFLDPVRFGGLDLGVSQDPNVIRNILAQDPSAGVINLEKSPVLNMATPLRQGLLHPSQVSNLRANPVSQLTIDANNSQEFREIAVISLDKLKSVVVGDIVQYEYIDESVGFGRGYRYYVNSIDRDMVESVRSQIVNITIEGIRIPNRPKRVFSYNVTGGVALNILVDDQLVEKFEVFRREDVIAFARQKRRLSSNVADIRGFNVNVSLVSQGENSFIKIGECLNASIGQGASYYDREVKPGLKYLYRVYSVDVFGNKSESPYEVEMFVPEPQGKANELTKPTLTAEVDATTNKARLVFKCSDVRVKNLFLGRRDLTIGQSAFTTPGQTNFIKLGNPNAGEGSLRFEDIVLRGENKDVSWSGMFENDTNEITYIDQTVSRDHIYQYRLVGVDLYGNTTSYEICKPFLIYNRPLINKPVNVTANVVQGPGFTVGGIKLSWQEGNIDISSEDIIGDQNSLDATAVRTLYQVERRKVGEERWIEFPMISDRQFFDPSPSTLGNQNPGFRPPLIETNQNYVYRVKALQTGSFVSNYSDLIEVFAGFPTTVPNNFRLRASDPKVRPFYIVLNWDTANESGIVDKWEIEKAVVNNYAAARLNVRNPVDFQSLSFKSFRSVFRESSRFRTQGLDLSIATARTAARLSNQTNGTSLSPTIFTGTHQFQDTDVQFGNTYFYRIRAVGVDGRTSSWIYRGMKITEESTEKLLSTLVTPEMMKNLSHIATKLTIPSLTSDRLSSFSLQPSFSQPKTTQVATVGKPPPLQVTVKNPTPLPTYSLQAASTKSPVTQSSISRAQILSETKPSILLFRGS